MIISVRLNQEDYNLLLEINNKINEQWKDIFLTTDTTTLSQTLRSCIRRTHYELLEKENNSQNISLTNRCKTAKIKE